MVQCGDDEGTHSRGDGRVPSQQLEWCIPMMMPRRYHPVAMMLSLCLLMTAMATFFRPNDTATGKPTSGFSIQSNSKHSSAVVEGKTSPFHDEVEVGSEVVSNDLTHFHNPCPTASRCTSLHPEATYNFVHVSKCAGSSWIRELRTLFSGRIYPKAEAGREHSVSWQRSHHPADYTLTSLRSPRHHLFSLFAECKYDEWGVWTTRGTSFPRDGGDDEVGDLIDFDAWLDHFVVPNEGGRGDIASYSPNVGSTDRYNCYHPANYQSRAFTSTVQSPTGVDPGDDGPATMRRYEPNFAVANETYWTSLDLVALAEFYHESKCLLFHRLTTTRGGPPNETAGDGGGGVISYPSSVAAAAVVEAMISYLDETCVCHRDGGGGDGVVHHGASNNTSSSSSSSAAMDDVKVDHHEGGHRSSMLPTDNGDGDGGGGSGGGGGGGVPRETLAKIDALTMVDVRLYRMALAELIREIAWMEGELGRRVLCDYTLKRWEPELEYVGLNVTEMYYATTTPTAT